MGFRSDRRDDDDGDDDLHARSLKAKPAPAVNQLEKLLSQVPPLIEKLQMEYSKYFNGTEKKVPHKMREDLDQIMDQIKKLQKQCSTQNILFRTNTVIQSYQTHKNLWDKKLLALEQGNGSPTSGKKNPLLKR